MHVQSFTICKIKYSSVLHSKILTVTLLMEQSLFDVIARQCITKLQWEILFCFVMVRFFIVIRQTIKIHL